MGSEAGFGYQGPPDAPGSDIQKEIRARELEDYISRRVKARAIKTVDQDIAYAGYPPGPLVWTAINWDSVDYDTSQMWDSTTPERIYVARGGEGDFTIIVKIFYQVTPYTAGVNLSGAALFKHDLNGDDIILSFTQAISAEQVEFSLIYTETMRPEEYFWVGIVNTDNFSGTTIKVLGAIPFDFNTFFSVRRDL